jgi:hypothetical protein
MTMALVANEVIAILPYPTAVFSATIIIREDFPFHYFRPDYFNISWLKESHIGINYAGLATFTLPPSVNLGAYSISKSIYVY